MHYPSFKNEKQYYKDSELFKEIKKILIVKEKEHNQNFKKSDEDKLELSMKLFFESMIKHNLSINSLRIDRFSLVDYDNSKDIRDTFLKIREKERDNRTDDDFKFLRHDSAIQNQIDLICLTALDKRDIISEIKNEYFELKNTQTEVKKPPKP